MADDENDAAYFERRAKELGLPTDPEAYQDGGLSVAATGANQVEAEMIAAALKEAGVPAWVEAPNSNILYGQANYGFFPSGPRVLVPMGRLADAEKVVAEHAARIHASAAEAQADEDEMAAEAEAEPFREVPEGDEGVGKTAIAQPGRLVGVILILLAATILVPILVIALFTSPLAFMLAITLILLGVLASWRSLSPRQQEGGGSAEGEPAKATSDSEPGEGRRLRAVFVVGIIAIIVGASTLIALPIWCWQETRKGITLGLLIGAAQALVVGMVLLFLGVKAVRFRRKV